MTFPLSRFLPELFGICLTLVCHLVLWRKVGAGWLRAGIAGSAAVGVAGLLCNMPHIWSVLPPGAFFTWGRGVAILWGILSCGMTLAYLFIRRVANAAPRLDAGRREMLQSAVVAAPAVVLGYGAVIERRWLRPVEVNLAVPGLPKDLDGVRIAQLSDIHMSSFLTPGDLAAAVDMANEYRPHLTVVTGDLITRDGDPLDDCLKGLGRLRAEAGVYGCLGNHEIYANCEDYTAREAARRGVRFLRGEGETLRFGQARLRLAGVDYQKMHGVYLEGAEALQEAGAYQVLLSHNPDVFDAAAAQGWDLTLAGHTHGGQVTVEYLNQHLNLARFFTPYVYGHYKKEKSQLYVTRGIGTVGVPVRLGAAPEVALIRLCAT
jgi:uncharacterized protein